jgi:hypothetical protein
MKNPEKYKEFKEYTGSMVTQMSLLIKDYFKPINFAELMQRYLELPNDKFKSPNPGYWEFKNLYLGDAIISNPQTNSHLIVLDSKLLRKINPDMHIVSGGHLIGETSLNSLQTYRNQKKQRGAIEIRGKIKETVLNNVDLALNSKLLRILNRHPDEVPRELAILGLHEEIIPYLFKTYKKIIIGNSFPNGRDKESPRLRGISVEKILGSINLRIGLNCSIDKSCGFSLIGVRNANPIDSNLDIAVGELQKQIDNSL